MISLNWSQMTKELEALGKSYEQLPKHIAKKHMAAALRRAVRKAGGVSILRQNTPPIGTRRGRRRKGEKARSTGDLRRSVTIKAGWKGTNADGTAYAMLGYKYGWNSRKAIWAEYGTNWRVGIGMMQRTFQQVKQPAAAATAGELAISLEKAVKELSAGKNPGYRG